MRSNICHLLTSHWIRSCVNSAFYPSILARTVNLTFEPCPGANNGAWANKKKCNRGNGTKLTPILRKSPFNLPRNRNEAVMPDITIEMTQFKSAYFGSFCFKTLCEMENNASLSITQVSSE
eukprot:120764_1